jgi:hypothetical protein
MTTTLTRQRATEIHSVGFIDQAKASEMPRSEGTLDRLISELLRAFCIAMAVAWIVTMVAGIFSGIL